VLQEAPHIEITRMFSRDAGHAGAQATDAANAQVDSTLRHRRRYSAWITRMSTSALSLAKIFAGSPAAAASSRRRMARSRSASPERPTAIRAPYLRREADSGGTPAKIFAKLNALVDMRVIQALYRASMAGSVDRLCRSRVVAAPRRARHLREHPGDLDRGGFLEHGACSRFGRGEEKFHLSSLTGCRATFIAASRSCSPSRTKCLLRALAPRSLEPGWIRTGRPTAWTQRRLTHEVVESPEPKAQRPGRSWTASCARPARRPARGRKNVRKGPPSRTSLA